MEFGWDPAKSEKTRRERGFGFEYAAPDFRWPHGRGDRSAPRLWRRADQGNRGNRSSGLRGDLHRSPCLRWIISAWKANGKDVRTWRSHEEYDPAESIRDEDIISPAVIRKRLGMSQRQFAAAIHVLVATLQNWEQGRTLMDPSARALMTILARAEGRLARARLQTGSLSCNPPRMPGCKFHRNPRSHRIVAAGRRFDRLQHPKHG